MSDMTEARRPARWWRPRSGWSWFLLVLLVVEAASFVWRLSEGLLDAFTLIFMVAFLWLFLSSQGVVGKGRHGPDQKTARHPAADTESRPQG